MISLLIRCVVQLSLLAGEIIKASVELPEWLRGDQKQGTSELVCLGDKMKSLQQGKRGVSLFSHIGVTSELYKCLTQILKGVYALVKIYLCVCECVRDSTLKYEEHLSGEKAATCPPTH